MHEDHTIRLWDVVKRAEYRRFTRAQPYSGRLRFAPDSRTFAYNDGGTLHFVEIASGLELRPSQLKGVEDFTFAAGGNWLVALGRDRVVRFLELATGLELYRLAPPDCGMSRVVMGTGDRTLLTLNEDATVLIWDLAPPGWARRAMAAPEAPEKLWAELGTADGAKAYRAVWALGSDTGPALPLLREHLPKVMRAAAVRSSRFRALIADLDNDDFARREAASLELAASGAEAGPTLRQALAGRPSPEVRRRLEALLPAAENLRSGELLRFIRGITALERIGTAEAGKLLETIAQGPPEDWMTQEAKASFERLTRRLGARTD